MSTISSREHGSSTQTRPSRPGIGDRVRHISTGHVGTLEGRAGTAVFTWSLVRWDPTTDKRPTPGMTERGLAIIAPGLLVRT